MFNTVKMVVKMVGPLWCTPTFENPGSTPAIMQCTQILVHRWGPRTRISMDLIRGLFGSLVQAS